MPPRMHTTGTDKTPLYVSLNGALVATDLLWEALVLFARRYPFTIFLFPFWLLRGRDTFARRIFHSVRITPASLPYRKEVTRFLNEQRVDGRAVILLPGPDRETAEAVAEHLGFFTEVSDVAASAMEWEHTGTDVLPLTSGSIAFDYVGYPGRNIAHQHTARNFYSVQPDTGRRIEPDSETPIPVAQMRILTAWRRALRVEQWIKNVLLFVPLVTAHLIFEPQAWVSTFIGFVSFCLCASAGYIINDLFDLSSDRRHPRKKNRPFASGALHIRSGILALPVLLTAAFGIAIILLPALFGLTLLMYFATAVAYSFHLKKVVIVDVLILAALYTTRVLAGAVVLEIPVSTWLLGFAMFMFISLAFLKRYSELRIMRDERRVSADGRGYTTQDMDLIRSVGPASGYLAVVVLALYINSNAVIVLYNRPAVLWFLAPVVLYWITMMWFIANRSEMDDDPIVYSVRDPSSYLLFLIVTVVLAAAWI